MLDQCWASVYDAVPALIQHNAHEPCMLVHIPGGAPVAAWRPPRLLLEEPVAVPLHLSAPSSLSAPSASSAAGSIVLRLSPDDSCHTQITGRLLDSDSGIQWSNTNSLLYLHPAMCDATTNSCVAPPGNTIYSANAGLMLGQRRRIYTLSLVNLVDMMWTKY